ncbi:MAG: membrane protein insertase YidC [Hyphomicrobiaceae bacterium]
MNQRDPDNSTNVMIAIGLSMVVLFGWQYFYAGPQMQAEQERIARETAAKSPVAQGATPSPGSPVAAPTPSATADGPATPGSTVAPPAKSVSRADAVAGQRIAIKTPSLTGSVPLTGGRIDDLLLVKYHETVDPKSPNVELFSPTNAPHPYFAEFGWVGETAAVKVPGADTVWSQDGSGALTPDSPVKLVWNNGSGLTFRRTIAVDADYMFTVTDSVDNTSGGDVKLYPYARVHRYGTPLVQGFFILHEGLIGVAGEQGLKEITYHDALKADNQLSLPGVVGGWLGITDKYWAAALIPDQSRPYRANFSGKPKVAGIGAETYQVDYLLEGVTVGNGQSHASTAHLYAGAKQVHLVEQYQEKLAIKQFDLMIDWGWFYFITKPLFHLIDWLYKLIGNFGLAILAVTVIVKAAFFPLANKSYESMAKMKKLQPEMEKLRERFKDDKARQQQELMALYQKEKINPLAGCLPILLQIPVFFALYKVLFVTIDMRHAPFYGWIKDLSAPDPTSLFNLFGLLPYSVPAYLAIGVWPVIMGLTMWVQMQLNPKQPDPTQQMIFNWMPVLFTFLLASFPAGLVIYWAWNNVLSILQQSMIMKRQGTEIPLKQNLIDTVRPVLRLIGVGGADKAKK